METMKPLIDKLVEMIQSGTDFVSGQAPDVAAQILSYKFIIAFIWMGIGATLFGSGVFASIFIFKYSKEDKDVMIIPLVGFFFVPGVTTFLIGLVDAIKIHVAPKLFLIETLRQFLK